MRVPADFTRNGRRVHTHTHGNQPGAEFCVNVLEHVQKGFAKGGFASSHHEPQVFVRDVGGHALQEHHEGPICAQQPVADLHVSRSMDVVHICQTQSVEHAVKVCACEPATCTLAVCQVTHMQARSLVGQ